MRKKIFLMITDAGGGHRGTANSLKAAIEKRGLPWDVRIVNVYKEVWQKIEFAQRVFKFSGEDVYNFVLRYNLIVWASFLRKIARLIVKLQFKTAMHYTREFMASEKPDFVLSIMPFVNDVYQEALEGSGIPFALLLSDLMDTKPYMWFTPQTCAKARFVGVGCDEAAAQAKEAGADGRILNCGLVIHPKYFDGQVTSLGKEAARERFGLDGELFTVMILMGGYGSSVIRHFVEKFEGSQERWQVVACCGKNEKLKAELETLAPRLKNKLVVLGFSTELHYLMRAVDLLLTKPGPASIMEGLAMRVPMVLDDFQTMPQEVPNADFVESKGLSVVVKQRSQMLQAVQQLAQEPARLEAIKANLQAFPLQDASPLLIEAMQKEMEKTPLKPSFQSSR